MLELESFQCRSPLNLTTNELEYWITKEYVKQLENNSVGVPTETEEDYQEVEKESSCSNDTEEFKDDEEDWESVEKTFEKIVSFVEKKHLFSSSHCRDARKLQDCIALKKYRTPKNN